jgi:creatine kinase/arginine kinase
MKKYLTDKLYESLKDKKTSNGCNIDQIINSGMKNSDSSIGAYAGDEESYKLFSPLFDKIIEDYHGFKVDEKHKSDFNPNNLDISNPDLEGKYILSTRIRVGRNIADVPLGSCISKQQRKDIELKISKILNSFDGELSGKYYSLENMSEDDRLSLIEDHFLFKAGDRFLESAGLNRDWPSGRGIFHNDDKTFLVWINEEDELRIISMQKGADIKEVFTRLSKAVSKISQEIKFAYDEHLGYISSCPTNLGTAMRASVHIKLPNLGKNTQEFENIADRYNLQIRGIDGEHSESKGGIYDISNKRRLGASEVECVKDMYNGVVALIKREKEL